MRLFGFEIKRVSKVEVPPPPRHFCQAETMGHLHRTVLLARDIGIACAAWKLYELLSAMRLIGR